MHEDIALLDDLLEMDDTDECRVEIWRIIVPTGERIYRGSFVGPVEPRTVVMPPPLVFDELLRTPLQFEPPPQAEPQPDTFCPYCYRRPCLGSDHPSHAAMHYNAPNEKEKRRRALQHCDAYFRSTWGNPYVFK